MSPENVVVAQVVFQAKPFFRKLAICRGEKRAYVEQIRKVLIVGGFNETTGRTVFLSSEKSTVPLDELTHQRIDHSGIIYDATECEGPTPLSLRKRRISRSWIDVEAEYRRRGGTGEPVSKSGARLLAVSPLNRGERVVMMK